MHEEELLLIQLHYLFALTHVHIYKEYFETKLCHQNAQTVASRVMHSLHFSFSDICQMRRWSNGDVPCRASVLLSSELKEKITRAMLFQ